MSRPIRTVLVIYKADHDQARAMAWTVAQWLAARDVVCLVRENLPDAAHAVLPAGAVVAVPPDLALVLGGDGTMLEAANALQGSGLPLMGLNIGSLGYLTCVGEDEFNEAIQALAHDTFTSDRRTTIAGVIAQADDTGTKLPDALNEVVVSRGCSGRLGWFNLAIDGEAVATVGCDGIVVATPTGSTAYALASGGPLLHPNTRALVITAISPHALTFRPLVIPDKSRVTITMARHSPEAAISVDGRDNVPMAMDARLELGLSPRDVILLHHAAYNPCTVMNRKLRWGGL